MLAAHAPADAAEAEDLEFMRTFLLEARLPFSRAQPDAHFTASAIVLSPDGSAVALLHHRKLDRVLQPGGHFEAEDGGDPLTAAMREAREELGVATAPVTPGLLDVDAHEIPDRGDVARHQHLDLRFLLRAASLQLAADAVETAGARWYAWHELGDMELDPALHRALRKAARVLRQDEGVAARRQ